MTFLGAAHGDSGVGRGALDSVVVNSFAMTSQTHLRAAIVTLLATVAAACAEPFSPPSAGTPTLDDPGIGTVVAVTTGGEHSCALVASGDAYCWGSNEFGQLGAVPTGSVCARSDRVIPCEAVPRAVTGGLKFQAIAAGGTHTCGVAVDGHVYCWGENKFGQLGDPSLATAASPAPALTSSLYTTVVAGDAHTCALRTDGVAVCWGANDLGQLGIATTGTGSAMPVPTQTNQRFASLAAGFKRTCGRAADGTTFCWGSQWVSRSIDGTEQTRSQAQPSRVQFSPAFSQLSVGGQTSCGLALDGAAWCWEANPAGTFGDGSTVGSTVPVHVKASFRFTSIAVGAQATCAVTDVGLLYCWGSDLSDQLAVPIANVNQRCGSESAPCILSPNKASGWRSYVVVASGVGNHSCGITLSGSVYCWGAGSMGQRGDGTAATQWSPTRVPLP